MAAVADSVDHRLAEVVERVAVGGDQRVERFDVAGAGRLDEQQVVDADEVEGRILAREASLHELPHLRDHRQRHLDLDAGQLAEARGARGQVGEDTPQSSCITLTVVPGSKRRICLLSRRVSGAVLERTWASARSKTSGRSAVPRPAPAGRRHHPVLDPRQLGHELAVPAACERAHALLDKGVGQVQREVRGGGVDDGPGAVVGGDRTLEGLGERGDLARLGDAADPAEIEDDDLRAAAGDQVAESGAAR